MALEVDVLQRFAAVWDEGDGSGQHLELRQRHTERRAHSRPQRLRAKRIGAALGQHHARAEGVGGAQQRAHVPRIGHAPQGERLVGSPQHLAPAEDADDARRMSERRNLCQQPPLDILAGDEQLVRLVARCERGVDQILALGDEQPELVAPTALVQLANELELLVLA